MSRSTIIQQPTRHNKLKRTSRRDQVLFNMAAHQLPHHKYTTTATFIQDIALQVLSTAASTGVAPATAPQDTNHSHIHATHPSAVKRSRSLTRPLRHSRAS
jgi:hypothetical protein